jgi:hypothetical protein
MIQNNLKTKILFFIVFIILLSNSIRALTGVKIIENASQYLTWRWYCNEYNAREGYVNGEYKSNRDENPKNNDVRYPFYSKGAKYIDERGVIQESDGYNTGVAYAWGLRDTIEIFGNGKESDKEKGGKLSNTEHTYLAGLLPPDIDEEGTKTKNKPWDKHYTGMDCAGFVANCIGLPVIRNQREYWIWHPGTVHFMQDYFADEITWDNLVKGDILVKKEHVALVTSSPTEQNQVEVIESAVRWDKVYASRVTKNTYTKVDGGIVRDHEPNSSKTYIPRRFNPPYAKRVSIYQEINVNGEVTGYEKIYEKYWVEKSDKTGREIKIPDKCSIKPAYPGKLIVKVDTTHYMCGY